MESNNNTEILEPALILPPELWTIIVSFLDVRSLRLRSVCKLFDEGLKNIKNYDMVALREVLDKMEKRKAAYVLNKLWHQDELETRVDLLTLKAPKWQRLTDIEAQNRPYKMARVAALCDPKIGTTSLFRAITDQKGYQDANPDSLSKRKFWEFKVLADDSYILKFSLVDNLEPKYLATVKVVLLCFSLTDRDSFVSMQKKWYQQYHDYCDINSYLFIVGLRADVPFEDRAVHCFRHPVSVHPHPPGLNRFFTLLKTVPNYFEVSSKDYTNVDKLMSEIIKAIHSNPPKDAEQHIKKDDSSCNIS